MFRFNFGSNPDTANPPVGPSPSSDATDASTARKADSPARIVFINHKYEKDAEDAQLEWDVVELCDGGLKLLKSTAVVPRFLSARGADVVPGLYEGGYKLWECAVDLCIYLHSHSSSTPLEGSDVLEIGAGHALPAITALKLGAGTARIHDYNAEVLHDCAAANVVKNNVSSDKVTYIAGDWSGLTTLLPAGCVDVVLSADTVYNPATVPSLARAAWHTLRPGGRALFAAKTYYFGVGGGTATLRSAFATVAGGADAEMEIEVVQAYRDGRSNVRELIQVIKKSSA